MKNKIITHPTDFSPCADNALNYAIAFAKIFDASIKIIHSIDYEGIAASAGRPIQVYKETERIEREVETKLRLLGNKVNENGLDCSSDIIQGEITEYLKHLNPEITVMGTTGSDSIENNLLGSMTYDVINKSNHPVLAVPLSAKYKSLETIVFATNFNDQDVNYLQILVQIAKANNADIETVHITSDANSKSEIQRLESLEKSVINKIEYPIKYRLLTSGKAEEGLEILLKETGADIIALVTRKRHFLEKLFEEGLTKKMAYNTKTPLLVFK
jgi:nucleotide-binding universal stress UspA family protein